MHENDTCGQLVAEPQAQFDAKLESNQLAMTTTLCTAIRVLQCTIISAAMLQASALTRLAAVRILESGLSCNTQAVDDPGCFVAL